MWGRRSCPTFELGIPGQVGMIGPPSSKIRHILREIDPTGMVISK